MWNHFINHPDVQAMLAAISGALSTLWSWIQQAGQAILEFFGVSSSANFDIVLAIMEALGTAWDYFKLKIETVITVVTAVYNAVSWAFNAIWSVVGPIIMQIVNLVRRLVFIFDLFKQGQISLPQLIYAVLSQLWVTYMTIMNYIVTLVVKFGSQLIQRAISAGRGFVNGIINWVKQLPGRVYSLLLQVVRRIISAGAQWVTSAKNKAKGIVDSVYNTLTGLPGKIGSALAGVASAITKPFTDAYNNVVREVDKIKRKASELSGGLIAFGGETAETTDLITGASFNIGTGQYIATSDNNSLVIEDNINLTLDLRNVPSHIDTGSLIEALSDKNVLNAIASNRDFQSIDAQVKQRINLKNSRSGR